MTEKKSPRLYKGRRNINVPLASLFKTVKSIVESGKEDEFLAMNDGLSVAAQPALVNAVKSHLFDTGAHLLDAHAASLVDSVPVPGHPPTCFPARFGE